MHEPEDVLPAVPSFEPERPGLPASTPLDRRETPAEENYNQNEGVPLKSRENRRNSL
jgi:hypothetical protein